MWPQCRNLSPIHNSDAAAPKTACLTVLRFAWVFHNQAITIAQFDANTIKHFFGLLGCCVVIVGRDHHRGGNQMVLGVIDVKSIFVHGFRWVCTSDPARVWIRYSMCTALRPAALGFFLLLIFGGNTGLLVRLLLLLLPGLLPAAALLAALATLATLLVLLFALVRHQLLLWITPRNNAGFPLNVPNLTA
jgi:hypothetical protein